MNMDNRNEIKTTKDVRVKTIWVTPAVFVANLDETQNNSVFASVDHVASTVPVGNHS
jgi:hypothetical protein